jgi:WD40 repeat protein
VNESRDASEHETKRARRTNRRLRVLLAGVAVLLAAAVAGGIFAVVQRGEARDAETAQLAQRLGAQALVEDDFDLSLLLARQAVAIDDSPQTRSYLLQDLLRSPKATGILHGDTDLLRSIAVSRDGRTLAVASYNDGVLLFDARTYERIGALPFTRIAEAVAYSPDGNRLAAGGDGYIRLFDARTREQLQERRVNGVVSRLTFTEDGSRLVAGIGETVPDSISIRHAGTLAPIGVPIAPDGFAGAYISSFWAFPGFALTQGGRSIVTASEKDELVWWDLRSRRPTRRLKIGTGHHALALSPNGSTIAVGIERGIQLVDAQSGRLRTAAGVLAEAPNSLLFSPDGKTVVSTGLDGAVTLWDVGSATPRETLRGHSASAAQAVYSPNGRTLYTTAHDGTAMAWDVLGDRGLAQPFRFTHSRTLQNFAHRHPGRFGPGGRLIAVGLKERGIGLLDARGLSPTGAPLLRTGGEVTALAFSRDGRTLAAGTSNGKVTIWDVASRSLRRGPFDVSASVESLSLSADGAMLATAGARGVKLWNVATGSPLGGVGDGRSAGAVAFSPSGRLVAFVRAGYPDLTEPGGDAEIWDVRQRSLIAKLEPDIDDSVVGYALAYTPDGKVLATAGLGDPLVHLWDVESGKLIRELEQNVGGAHELEFSRDGSILAVAGYGEPYAALFDVATGAQIGPRLKAGSDSAMVDMSPNGRRLLQTHGNGKGAIWDIDPESWARRACTLAGRVLTRAEWEEFLPSRPYEPACR